MQILLTLKNKARLRLTKTEVRQLAAAQRICDGLKMLDTTDVCADELAKLLRRVDEDGYLSQCAEGGKTDLDAAN